MNNKKSILFIINNLSAGGAENALVSLLQEFDYHRYHVDLLLFKQEGIFMKNVPDQVNLLPAPVELTFFDMPFSTFVLGSLSRLRPDIFFARILYTFFAKPEPVATVREQKMWRYLKRILPANPKNYDAAIGYLENTPNFYLVDKVKATKKIAFIRNDYQKLGMDASIDRPYFKQLTALLSVSRSSGDILKSVFGDLSIEIGYMQSIFSKPAITHLANEEVNENFDNRTIVSVGRLVPQKRFDLAVQACKILIDRGYPVKWYVLGEGPLYHVLKNLTDDLGVQNNFLLLGLTENPYPYIKNSAIYVQTSSFEGKSRAIEEAKILAKPIVVTNYPTVNDQIVHKVTGYIVDLVPEEIANGIIELFENAELTAGIIDQLHHLKVDNTTELNKLYDIIEN